MLLLAKILLLGESILNKLFLFYLGYLETSELNVYLR